MKRFITDTMGLLCVVTYIELKYLHMFIEQSNVTDSLGTLLIPCLMLPIISIAARVIDRSNARVKRNAVVLTVKDKEILINWNNIRNQRQLEQTSKSLIQEESKILTIALQTLFAETAKLLSARIKLKPLVVVIDKVGLTTLEQKSLKEILIKSGALEVSFSDGLSNESVQDAINTTQLKNII